MLKVDSCLNYFFIYNVESLDMVFIISFTLDKYKFFPGYDLIQLLYWYNYGNKGRISSYTMDFER